MNIEDYIYVEVINKDNYLLSSLDIINHNGVFSPEISTIKNKLIKKIDNKKIYQDFLKNIKELSNKYSCNDIVKKFNIGKDLEWKKVITKIMMASNYIGIKNRIGKANNILLSKNNYIKYNLKEIDSEYNFLFDENQDNIIIFRKTDKTQNGLIMIKNNKYYDFVQLGLNPHVNFLELKIEK